jgi:hypothetical protein
MHKFEEKFYLSTLKFIGRYENDEMEETMDYAKWNGSVSTECWSDCVKKTLRGISFAN